MERRVTKIDRARQIIRELYVDTLGPLTNKECDKIMEGQRCGLGPLFITSIIQATRSSKEKERLDFAKRSTTSVKH